MINISKPNSESQTSSSKAIKQSSGSAPTQGDKMMTEKQFQGMVEQLAKTLGWKIYHTWRSFHSVKGYPDLTMVRDDKLIFAELKREGAKLSPEQREWLATLDKVPSVKTYCWHPSEFDEIARVLQGKVKE